MKFDVPFVLPSMPPAHEVAEDYEAILVSNRFSNFGPFESQFRDAISAYVRQDVHAVTFASATSGLLAAVIACFGEGDGRYVLMPSFTFPAAAQTVLLSGFRPLLVDIEPVGLHADLDQARALHARYGAEIAGVVFCNAFGVASEDAEKWDAFAEAHALPIVVDSAAGFGSRRTDQMVLGAGGTCEVFSFHATKTFAIGEGGAVTTRSSELAARLKSLSNFGFTAGGTVMSRGFNGKLSELPAAIGVRQLSRLDANIADRQQVFGWYRQFIAEAAFQPGAENSSLSFVCAVLERPHAPEAIIPLLAERGIEARAYYSPALHRHSAFRAGARGDLTVTEAVESRVLSLPCHAGVTREHVETIAAVIAAAA